MADKTRRINICTLLVLKTTNHWGTHEQHIVLERTISSGKHGKLLAKDANTLANVAEQLRGGLTAASRAGEFSRFLPANQPKVVIYCYCYADCTSHQMMLHARENKNLPAAAVCIYHSIATGNR